MTIHTAQPSILVGMCICGLSLDHGDHGYRPTEPIVRARRTDPETSHEAAASVDHITRKMQEVFRIIGTRGPLTDEEVAFWHETEPYRSEFQSPSGLRTRRSELVKAGLVYDTGERRIGSTGRRMIVWAAR